MYDLSYDSDMSSKLTHQLTVRVMPDFPRRLRLAAVKADLPQGALLDRLLAAYEREQWWDGDM